MAKITITFEDTEEEDTLHFAYTSDNPGGVIASNGTMAERFAYKVISAVAEAVGKKVKTVSNGESN